MSNTSPAKLSVYGKANCPFCDKAKDLLDRYNVNYIYYDVGQPQTLDLLKALHPSVKTVPQIFILNADDKEIHRIGGYDDLAFIIERMFNETEARAND